MWEALLARAGVTPTTISVLYGDANTWFAALASWLGKRYGHADVKLMNGGRPKWLTEGRSVTSDESRSSATEFSGDLLAPEHMPQEGAPRGGLLPGAATIPWATAVAADGTFTGRDELAALSGGQGITAAHPTITYCQIGERSAQTGICHCLTSLLPQHVLQEQSGDV